MGLFGGDSTTVVQQSTTNNTEVNVEVKPAPITFGSDFLQPIADTFRNAAAQLQESASGVARLTQDVRRTAAFQPTSGLPASFSARLDAIPTPAKLGLGLALLWGLYQVTKG